MSDEDAVMTVKEVSAYLRLAESTVYKLAQEGQLGVVCRLWHLQGHDAEGTHGQESADWRSDEAPQAPGSSLHAR